MADLTHDPGGRVVDKDSYTGKCIIVMASLTEVRFRGIRIYRLDGPDNTAGWCRSEGADSNSGAERGSVDVRMRRYEPRLGTCLI